MYGHSVKPLYTPNPVEAAGIIRRSLGDRIQDCERTINTILDSMCAEWASVDVGVAHPNSQWLNYWQQQANEARFVLEEFDDLFIARPYKDW